MCICEQIGVHQGCASILLAIGIMVDLIMSGHGKMNEILNADDLVLMSGKREKYKRDTIKMQKAFESKKMQVNLWMTKIMLNDLKNETTNQEGDGKFDLMHKV